MIKLLQGIGIFLVAESILVCILYALKVKCGRLFWHLNRYESYDKFFNAKKNYQKNLEFIEKIGDCGIIDPYTQRFDGATDVVDTAISSFHCKIMKFILEQSGTRRVLYDFQHRCFLSDAILFLPTGIYFISYLKSFTLKNVNPTEPCWVNPSPLQEHQLNFFYWYEHDISYIQKLVQKVTNKVIPIHVIMVGKNKKMLPDKKYLDFYQNPNHARTAFNKKREFHMVCEKDLVSYLNSLVTDGKDTSLFHADLSNEEIRELYKKFCIQNNFYCMCNMDITYSIRPHSQRQIYQGVTGNPENIIEEMIV